MSYKITLEAARVNAGFTQKQVAQRLGITKETISRWEKGKTSPKADMFLCLINLYGVPIEMIKR